MTRNNSILQSVFLAALACGVAVPASANLVLNGTFIAPPPPYNNTNCAVGCSYSTNTPITDWTTTNQDVTGQFQPGTTNTYFNSGPDNEVNGTYVVAYTNGGMISQLITAPVTGIYTFDVYIGERSDLGSTGTADVEVSDPTNGTNTFDATTLTPLTSGEFSLFSTTFSASAGDRIDIQLSGSGPQGDFGNASLTATPEPGFYGLLALGLSGLTFAAVRRRSGGKLAKS